MLSATTWQAVPFAPEITLLTAAEPFEPWDRTDRRPALLSVPRVGGQAPARYILGNPGLFAGGRCSTPLQVSNWSRSPPKPARPATWTRTR